MGSFYELDCFSEICPIPILRIKKELPKLKSGDTLKVISDHSCVVESILDHMKQEKVTVTHEEVMNGVWEIFITVK